MMTILKAEPGPPDEEKIKFDKQERTFYKEIPMEVNFGVAVHRYTSATRNRPPIVDPIGQNLKLAFDLMATPPTVQLFKKSTHLNDGNWGDWNILVDDVISEWNDSIQVISNDYSNVGHHVPINNQVYHIIYVDPHRMAVATNHWGTVKLLLEVGP